MVHVIALIAVALIIAPLTSKKAPKTTRQEIVQDLAQALPTISSSNDKAHHYRHILLFNRNAALGHHESCSRLLEKIYKHDPNFSSSTMLNHLLSTNQFEEVTKAASRYRIHYGNEDWEVNLAAARAHAALKQDTEAEKMFHEASKSAKKVWAQEQTAYAQAVFYIQNNKSLDAIREIDNFLATTTPRTKHALFYFLKATIYLNGKHPQFDTALAQLNKGLELNPHFERALKLKALVLEQQDNKPELVLVLKKIIELEPQIALSKRLVSLYFELGQLDDAYKTLTEIEEKSADHFYDMALISWKMKRHDQALTHVEQAIKLNTEFSRARLLKLEILLTSDRKTEALNHLKGWIVKNKDAKTFSILSMLTGSSTVSPQEAIALLESITNQPSIQKEIHSFLGDLHALTGNYKAAEKSYRYFLRALGKSDRPMGLKAMYNLGFVQWKQGNVKEALTEIGRAHSLDQKHPLITSFLAFLYTQQEDKHKVRKAKELLELARNIEQNPDQTPSELCMAGKTSNLSSILAAQADAYKLSPFWLNLETSGIQPEVPKLDSHVTMTAQNTGLCI